MTTIPHRTSSRPPAHRDLASFVREPLRPADLDALRERLAALGTLHFDPLPTGLFSASPATQRDAAVSGYRHVWARDNVFVALAHLRRGDLETARGVVAALLRFYGAHRHRFEAIVAGEADADDPMSRPHVRFDGRSLSEVSERWPHAQNDALGYVLWLTAHMLRIGVIDLDGEARHTLAAFPAYFRAIRYWEDRDSGHWEESRKLSASSIGVVVAGVEELARAAEATPELLRNERWTAADLRALAGEGRRALARILPSESVSTSGPEDRRYDAALLFLVFPLGVVQGPMAARIVSDVSRYLEGEIGIRRYLLDSYWAPDYDLHLAASDRTRDYSEDLAARDQLLTRIGEEAQWSIFDPILSVCWGEAYRRERSPAALRCQLRHLQRTLAQITPEDSAAPGRCPELHYLRSGRYVPNPHTPLYWAQANLVLALEALASTRDA